MKDEVQKVLRVANYIRDKAKKPKGEVGNNSELNAAFKTELYLDEGVIKTRPVKQNEDTNDQ